MITDYDCWHPEHEAVTGMEVLENLRRNIANVQKVIREAARLVPEGRGCKCERALAQAIVTARENIPARTKKKLAAILRKYLK